MFPSTTGSRYGGFGSESGGGGGYDGGGSGGEQYLYHDFETHTKRLSMAFFSQTSTGETAASVVAAQAPTTTKRDAVVALTNTTLEMMRKIKVHPADARRLRPVETVGTTHVESTMYLLQGHRHPFPQSKRRKYLSLICSASEMRRRRCLHQQPPSRRLPISLMVSGLLENHSHRMPDTSSTLSTR